MRFTTVLKENHEFRRLYSRGKSSSNGLLVLYVRRGRRNSNRMGITVSTKVGKAVVRNKVKRRLREIYRLNEEKMAKGCDMIIVARVRAAGADYASLEAAFLSLCSKLGVLKEESDAV